MSTIIVSPIGVDLLGLACESQFHCNVIDLRGCSETEFRYMIFDQHAPDDNAHTNNASRDFKSMVFSLACTAITHNLKLWWVYKHLTFEVNDNISSIPVNVKCDGLVIAQNEDCVSVLVAHLTDLLRTYGMTGGADQPVQGPGVYCRNDTQGGVVDHDVIHNVCERVSDDNTDEVCEEEEREEEEGCCCAEDEVIPDITEEVCVFRGEMVEALNLLSTGSLCAGGSIEELVSLAKTLSELVLRIQKSAGRQYGSAGVRNISNIFDHYDNIEYAYVVTPAVAGKLKLPCHSTSGDESHLAFTNASNHNSLFLVVKTKDVFADVNGKLRSVGDMLIVATIVQGTYVVRMFNTTRLYGYHEAAHVGSEGKVCFGNVSPNVKQYLADGLDLSGSDNDSLLRCIKSESGIRCAIDTMLMFLRTPTPTDAWGSVCTQYPEVVE